MDARKKRILEVLIEDFIGSAEPIGSRAIFRKHDLGISPATIRNEMADLEEEGFLTHPYTSAGRIPSDKGYRYYIDNLMQEKSLTEHELKIIENEFANLNFDFEEIVHHTLKVLTQLSNLVGFFTSPKIYRSTVKLVQLLLFNVRQVLIILLTNTHLSEKLVLETKNEYSQDELNTFSNFLTDKLSGLSLEMINNEKINEIISEFPQFRELAEGTTGFISNSKSLDGEERVFISGTSAVMKQPEFREASKVQRLLEILEEEKLFLQEINKFFDEDQISVKIGSENKCKQIQECSMVLSSYKCEDISLGALGVLGPTRMEYARLTTLVQNISKVLCKKFDEVTIYG
jgi:heat-inducible transcriptional repressor